jgi:predicted DNA-binding protein
MATRHSIAAAATPDSAPAIEPAEKTAEPKSKTPVKRTRAAQPESRAKAVSTTRKASSKASASKTPAKALQGGLSVLVGGLVEKAATDAQGTVQVAVRVSPRTKQRLRESMIRAGLVQEKFIALLIEQGLDELDEVLATREAAEK